MRSFLALALGSFATIAVGCSAHHATTTTTTTTTDDAATVQAALESDNGGMTSSNEQPAFADAKVAQISAFDPSFADATDVTTEAAALPGARRYHVALLWGHLPTPHDADNADVEPTAVDWTGSIGVDAGAIGLKKTLKFDLNDHVTPRTDPKSVAFVSHTLPFVDGLFLSVVVPAGGSSVLHFKTAALTTDVDLAQLDTKEGGVVRLGDGHNGLAFIGYPDAPGCARGLLFGRWNKLHASIGVFRGHVVDGNGDPLGHIRGVWGHPPRRDADVFFGKYIGVDGTHHGLFGGKYGDGHFAGLWGTRDPRDAGTLEGFYADGYDRDDGRGVFLGRWSERCQ